jgi:hypothetical protein
MLLAMSLIVPGLLVISCQSHDEFTPISKNDFFIQDFNPQTLDILWVIDDRSPMSSQRTRIINYAKAFFTKLDSVARDYQMGFTTMDPQFNQGQLKPNSLILKYNYGSTEARANVVGDFMINQFNLSTGASNAGLQMSVNALENHFPVRDGVPLVVIYMSYTDDHSALPAGETDAVAYFKTKLLEIKGNDPDLIRVYAINYEKYPVGTPSPVPQSTKDRYRCIDQQNPDIDRATFQDKFFRLAAELGGEKGDICASDFESGFASQIDLTGLQLKVLPKRFRLSKTVNSPSSIDVTVYRGSQIFPIGWHLDSATNEIVFDTTPEQGTTIQVIYL